MAGSKKQITFDLKQKLLKDFYPKPENTENERYYKKAYADIKRFMEKNGFQHSLLQSVDDVVDDINIEL